MAAKQQQKILLRDCRGGSVVDTAIGGMTVGIFIVVWVGSLLSPVLFWLAIQSQRFVLSGSMVGLAIAAYLPWKKGFISKYLTNFVDWYHPRYYHSCMTLFHESASPEGSTKTFYAVHPHGAFCLGWSTLFHSDFMKSVRFCFSPALYYSPFFKLWCRLTGKPGKADKASMIAYMKRGESLALPPGGFEEATLHCSDIDRVYIKKRAGFVKLCLSHGYTIVPVYCFGEKTTYWNAQGAWSSRLALNSLGLPAICIWGLNFLPVLPKRTHMLVVAGQPIECPLIDSPTRADVSKYHNHYMASLQRIFEEHKELARYEKDAKLELW